jgi:hypothetical protein
MPNASYQQH